MPLVLILSVLAWSVCAHAELGPTGNYRLEDIRQRCIPFSQVRIGPNEKEHDAARCRVSSFRAFGSVSDNVYYRALYCLTPHRYAAEPQGGCAYHGSRGMAIFIARENSASAQLLLERAIPDIGILLYREPAIVMNSHGTILHVSIALDGTGAGNESEYYLLRNGAWQPIDARSWLTQLKSYIPGGLEIWKGVWPDLNTMTAEIGLYRKGDANCCPTGGSLQVALHIQSSAFVLKSAHYEP